MIREAPADIKAEMRASAGAGISTRSSASAALADAHDRGRNGLLAVPAPRALGLAERTSAFLAASSDSDSSSQRKLTPSGIASLAVKRWVPSGSSGRATVTGALNTGWKPLRTKTLPSFLLTKTVIGPGRSGRSGPNGTTDSVLSGFGALSGLGLAGSKAFGVLSALGVGLVCSKTVVALSVFGVGLVVRRPSSRSRV